MNAEYALVTVSIKPNYRPDSVRKAGNNMTERGYIPKHINIVNWAGNNKGKGIYMYAGGVGQRFPTYNLMILSW